MGFILEPHGNVGIEVRRKSFYIYSLADEFKMIEVPLEDLNELIQALEEAKQYIIERDGELPKHSKPTAVLVAKARQLANNYPITSSIKDDSWTAKCPAIEVECFGSDEQQVINQARMLISSKITTLLHEGKEVPKP